MAGGHSISGVMLVKKGWRMTVSVVILALIFMGAMLLPPAFRRNTELRRRAAHIKRTSDREIRPGALEYMYFKPFGWVMTSDLSTGCCLLVQP